MAYSHTPEVNPKMSQKKQGFQNGLFRLLVFVLYIYISYPSFLGGFIGKHIANSKTLHMILFNPPTSLDSSLNKLVSKVIGTQQSRLDRRLSWSFSRSFNSLLRSASLRTVGRLGSSVCLLSIGGGNALGCFHNLFVPLHHQLLWHIRSSAPPEGPPRGIHVSSIQSLVLIGLVQMVELGKPTPGHEPLCSLFNHLPHITSAHIYDKEWKHHECRIGCSKFRFMHTQYS